MFPRLKAHIDRKNAEWMAQQPLHEQDQIDEAAKTYRGTARYIFNALKEARKR